MMDMTKEELRDETTMFLSKGNGDGGKLSSGPTTGRVSGSSSAMASVTDAESSSALQMLPFDANLSPVNDSQSSFITPESTIACKRRRQTTKRVVFRKHVTVRRYSQCPMTEEDVAQMWYGNETKRRAKADVIHILKRQRQEETTESIYLAQFTEARNASETEGGKLDENLRKIAMDSDARGLEHCLIPEVNMLRRKVIYKILRAQDKLPPMLSDEERRFCLRGVSLRLTRPARRMAELIAAGDAMIVSQMRRRVSAIISNPS